MRAPDLRSALRGPRLFRARHLTTIDSAAGDDAVLSPEPDAAEAEEAAVGYGLADLDAAVALVQRGLATRVVLTRFPTWPGSLTYVAKLALDADVEIVVTRVGPRATVDLEVSRRDTSADG